MRKLLKSFFGTAFAGACGGAAALALIFFLGSEKKDTDASEDTDIDLCYGCNFEDCEDCDFAKGR